MKLQVEQETGGVKLVSHEHSEVIKKKFTKMYNEIMELERLKETKWAQYLGCVP